MSNWDAFAKDAATWVDTAGAGLLELMRRHGLKDPGGPVSDHYPFAVLEGVVAGFEAGGFILDEVSDYDAEPKSFGPVVNGFGARAAVESDQAPAAGPVVNGPGLAAAAGDPWDVTDPAWADAPAGYTVDDFARMREELWAGDRPTPLWGKLAGYDQGGWLPSGRTAIPGAVVTAKQSAALDALAEGVADDDDVEAWARVVAGTGVDPDVLKRHASLVKSAQETVRAVGVEL